MPVASKLYDRSTAFYRLCIGRNSQGLPFEQPGALRFLDAGQEYLAHLFVDDQMCPEKLQGALCAQRIILN